MFNFNFGKRKDSLLSEDIENKDEKDSVELEKEKKDKKNKRKEEVWNSLDDENLYNEPGYQEESVDMKESSAKKLEFSQVEDEISADIEPGGEMGELMEKYELEEWELKDMANKCLKYFRGEAQKPFNDEEKINELVEWYLDYLPTENEYGLALSEEELSRLKEEEKNELSKLKKERVDTEMQIAQLSSKLANLTKTIESQEKIDYSTEIKQAKADFDKFKKDFNDLYKKLNRNLARNNKLEEKAITDPVRIAKEEEERERQRLEKEYQAEKDKKPFFGKEEIKLHDNCLDYLTRDGRKKEVPSYMGQELSKEQIINTAREAAIDKLLKGEMLKASFFVENYNGKRQLSSVDKFFDADTKMQKRIKYIFVDDNLPAGYYAFKINPDKFRATKNNPNSAMAHLDLIVDIDNRRKAVKKKTA